MMLTYLSCRFRWATSSSSKEAVIIKRQSITNHDANIPLFLVESTALEIKEATR